MPCERGSGAFLLVLLVRIQRGKCDHLQPFAVFKSSLQDAIDALCSVVLGSSRCRSSNARISASIVLTVNCICVFTLSSSGPPVGSPCGWWHFAQNTPVSSSVHFVLAQHGHLP